jgi:hypothetical protein
MLSILSIMALNTDLTSVSLADQHEPFGRAVGIVTTRTGKGIALPPPFLRTGKGVPADRVTAGDAGQSGMAADAKFVDRLDKHELAIAGMGIMTGDAPTAGDDAVDKG